MILPRTSIERPVLALVISLLLIVLGIGSLLTLPVREYPDVDPPTVAVTTTYPGASAEVVEREVTQVIEESISSIEGIDTITSTSREALSRISIEFVLERDLDAAAADVRDKLGEVRADLPDGIDPPVISKTSADADAMMWITLTSDQRGRLELTDFADRNLVDPLSVVDGVSSVIIGGERRYAMRIWLDPTALAARQVTVDEVLRTLQAGNVELPAGRVESQTREFTVRTATKLSAPEEFRALPIRQDGGYLVTLGDVARVEVGAEQERSIVRSSGQPSVGLGIVRQSNANTLTVAEGVLAELERLRAGIPDDIEADIGYNEAIFIQGSIREVIRTLAITAGVVITVIFLFLRSLRTVLIPAATIPVSLIASFMVVLALGYSVNTLTLLALVLAIGLVVDDSIVVTENIYRRNEEGEPRLLAAARGADQISFAVIATTAVLISVFVPLAFLTGTVGRLFTEFAAALAAAVAFSSLIALTLASMLASRLVDADRHAESRFYRVTERGFQAASRGYRRLLEKVVAAPLAIVLVAAVLSGGTYLVYRQLPQELAPTEDRGYVIIPVQAPEGATLDYTLAQVERIEAVVEPLIGPDGPVAGTISIVGAGGEGPPEVDRGFIILRLKPWGEREQHQEAIAGELLPQLLALPGADAFAVSPPSLGQQGASRPVQFVIGGPAYGSAHAWAEQVLARAGEVPGLVNPQLDYETTKPQIQIDVDRAAIADLGISAQEVGEALQVLFGELDVTDYADRGETYDVMVRAEPSARSVPDDLRQVYLRASASGELVQLAGLVELREVGVPPELRRVDRVPSVTLEASLAPGAALGDALAALDRIAAEELPSEARVSYLGQSKEYQQSSAGLYVAFGLALVIVFLVLAGQFESFLHPVSIMAAVPLAVAGGLLALWLAGFSFNIFSQIGLILLIGLTAKNGILIVEFANQLRDQGRGVREAILEAGAVRLRPVVMTSCATGFGVLPLALSTGPGAEGRAMIGVVVIGGIILATLLTLFLVPALYLLLARFTRPGGEVAARLRDLERQDAAGHQRLGAAE